MKHESWVIKNRATQKWPTHIQVLRVFWGLLWPLFALSPRQLWCWRRWLLRLFGAKVGAEVHVYPSVKVIMPWNLELGEASSVGDGVILYSLGRISIGPRTSISQGAHLCAGSHDYRNETMPLLKLPINIGCDVWVCADAFVGPGVNIGDRAVIGARSVVVKNVSPDIIVAGNPAREIRSRYK